MLSALPFCILIFLLVMVVLDRMGLVLVGGFLVVKGQRTIKETQIAKTLPNWHRLKISELHLQSIDWGKSRP